jgi:hypothetical protein
MPITYSMKIDSLDCVPSLDGLSNVVSRAIWTMNGTDGDLTASTSASTEFPAPSPEQPFISFDDLTEETVIGWVEDCADATYLESRREVIAGMIAAQIAPPVITPPLPWAEPAAQETPE